MPFSPDETDNPDLVPLMGAYASEVLRQNLPSEFHSAFRSPADLLPMALSAFISSSPACSRHFLDWSVQRGDRGAVVGMAVVMFFIFANLRRFKALGVEVPTGPTTATVVRAVCATWTAEQIAEIWSESANLVSELSRASAQHEATSKALLLLDRCFPAFFLIGRDSGLRGFATAFDQFFDASI